MKAHNKNCSLSDQCSDSLFRILRGIVLVSVVMSGLVFAEEEDESETVAEEGSSETEPELPRVGNLNVEALQQELLAKEFKANELVWLEAEYPAPEGEESGTPIDPVKVLALKKDSHKAQKHGAVLLLHDKEQHADWPYLIRPIRTMLPESGWYSLSVNLPFEKQYFEELPQRSLPAKSYDEITVTDDLRAKLMSRIASTGAKNGDEQADDSAEGESDEDQDSSNDASASEDGGAVEDSEESVDIDLADPKEREAIIPYEKRALAHLESAAAHLQNEGYQNVVLLAYGSSANAVLSYVKQRQGQFSDRGFAIVFIDPKIQAEYQDDISSALGQNFPAPVLDLITRKTDRIKEQAAERKVSATVGGIKKYMQIYIPETQESASKTIPRRIRFWLEKYAPGMVVKGR